MPPVPEDRFAACAAAVMAQRAAYEAHDPVLRGPSAHGIGLGLLSVWLGGPARTEALQGLGATGAARILRQMVWAPLGAARLAAGPDLALFAFAVDAGTIRAMSELQAELGVHTTGAADAATIAAAQARTPRRLAEAIARRHAAWRHARGLEAPPSDTRRLAG